MEQKLCLDALVHQAGFEWKPTIRVILIRSLEYGVIVRGHIRLHILGTFRRAARTGIKLYRSCALLHKLGQSMFLSGCWFGSNGAEMPRASAAYILCSACAL